MLVISPFSRGGFVSSALFDHTSVLRFLETRFSAEVPNLSAWRRATVGDLTSAFNFRKPDQSVPLCRPRSQQFRRSFRSVPQSSRHNAISSSEPAKLSDAGSWNGGSTKWSMLGIRFLQVKWPNFGGSAVENKIGVSVGPGTTLLTRQGSRACFPKLRSPAWRPLSEFRSPDKRLSAKNSPQCALAYWFHSAPVARIRLSFHR